MTPDVSQRSVLDRYTPATLGAVTAIHDLSETGGVSVVVDGAEHRFRLSLRDLVGLRDDLGAFIAAHLSRRVHSAELGAGADVQAERVVIAFDAIDDAAVNFRKLEAALSSLGEPLR